MQVLLELPKDKLAVIPLPGQTQRNQLHSFLETTHPTLKKQSLRSHLYQAEEKGTYKRCCGKLVKLTYHYGHCDNNQDEQYSGNCPKCGERVRWECNYDDFSDIVRLYHNNVIVVGSYINTTRQHGSAQVACTLVQAAALLVKYPPLVIDAPPRPRSANGNLQYLAKTELQDYIDAELSKGDAPAPRAV